MAETQWFHDEEFDIPLPDWLSEDIARFYGIRSGTVDFAQGLAAYLSARGLRLLADPASAAPAEPGFVATEPWELLLKSRSAWKPSTFRDNHVG